MNPNDFEQDILVGLNFDFTESLKSKSSYAHKLGLSRIRFHRQFEIVRNQFTLVAIFLARIYSKAGWTHPKIAILSPDLFPETNEALAHSVMELMAKHGLETPRFLSRRKDFKKNSLSFTSLAPWHDVNVWNRTISRRLTYIYFCPLQLLSQFDLVLIVTSNANFNIVNEIIPFQKNIEKTIFFAGCSGMEYARVKNLLGVNLLVLPFSIFDDYPGDSKISQQVDFEKIPEWQQGPRLADLTTIKKTIASHLLNKGLKEEYVEACLLQTIPTTEIDGIEKANEILSERLHYRKQSN